MGTRGIRRCTARFSRAWADEAGTSRDRPATEGSRETQDGTRHPKKSRGLLRQGIDVKFGFVAKHRGIWPVAMTCDTLGISRSGFYAWLTRTPSMRSQANEQLITAIHSSFMQSDRTYGARRVWHDLLATGHRCGLHRVE